MPSRHFLGIVPKLGHMHLPPLDSGALQATPPNLSVPSSVYEDAGPPGELLALLPSSRATSAAQDHGFSAPKRRQELINVMTSVLSAQSPCLGICPTPGPILGAGAFLPQSRPTGGSHGPLPTVHLGFSLPCYSISHRTGHWLSPPPGIPGRLAVPTFLMWISRCVCSVDLQMCLRWPESVC